MSTQTVSGTRCSNNARDRATEFSRGFGQVAFPIALVSAGVAAAANGDDSPVASAVALDAMAPVIVYGSKVILDEALNVGGDVVIPRPAWRYAGMAAGALLPLAAVAGLAYITHDSFNAAAAQMPKPVTQSPDPSAQKSAFNDGVAEYKTSNGYVLSATL